MSSCFGIPNKFVRSIRCLRQEERYRDGCCGQCVGYGRRHLRPPPAPENAEDKPVKAPAPRRRIDKGKVLALHRAGWTNKAIAEEVRCSEASVSVIIKEEMK